MSTEIQELKNEVSQLKEAIIFMARNKGESLTSTEVVARVGRTRQTITSMIRRGKFPTPRADGRWLLADIMEWENSKPRLDS